MNAFTLFGELKIGTSGFENSLFEAEVRLNKTGKAISDTERQAKKLGQTNQSTARTYEKLSNSVRENRERMNQALDAYKKGEISLNRLSTVLRQTDARVHSLNSRLKDNQARLNDLPSRGDRFARSLERVNTYLALGAAGIVAFAVKGATDIENLRNRFTALEGSTEKANKRIERLLNLSRQNVGVNFGDSLENFAQLQAIGDVGEESIEKIIKALGRLDTAFTIDSQSSFLRNLTQIFTQGFERADIKEAIGRVPIFEQLIEQAFGTKDQEALKKLKESGKLTLDSWIAGLANAVNEDKRMQGLRETLSSKVMKALTELNVSAEPLVRGIFDSIQPEIDAGLAGLQNKDYTAVGNAIGGAIGKAVGSGMRGALQAEFASFGEIKGFGDQIAKGFNADSATTVIQQFFRKIKLEIQQGIVDITAASFAISPAGVGGSAADAILEQLGFTRDASNSFNQGVKSYFRERRETLFAEYERDSVALLQKSKDAYQKIADDTSVSDAVRASAAKQVESISNEIEAAQGRLTERLNAAAAEQGKRLGQGIAVGVPGTGPEIGKSITDTVANAAKNSETSAGRSGLTLGQNIALGIAAGLRSSSAYNAVSEAISGIIGWAFSSGQKAQESKSPSERAARELGLPFAQGIALGIAQGEGLIGKSVTDTINKSMFSPAVKKAIATQIKELNKALAAVTTETGILASGKTTDLRTQVFEAERGKSVLEDLLRIRQEMGVNVDKPLILGPNALREIAELNAVKDAISTIVGDVKELTKEKDPLTNIFKTFADPRAADELKRQADALGLTVEKLKLLAQLGTVTPEWLESVRELGQGGPLLGTSETGTGSAPFGFDPEAIASSLEPPPRLKPMWEDFWTTLRTQAESFKNSLPSIKQSIGENLLGSLMSIGDIIGSSIARADGTLRGFFTSIAQGFRQMAQSIIGDLVRILIYKSLLSLFGSFAGGTAQTSGGFMGIGTGGMAEGGLVRGPGTSKSDSVFARLSNGEFVMSAKSVKKLGVGFLNSLNSLKMPALSGGGTVSPSFVPNFSGSNSSVTTTNAPVNNFHYHFHNNNADATFAKRSAEQAAKSNVAFINRSVARG